MRQVFVSLQTNTGVLETYFFQTGEVVREIGAGDRLLGADRGAYVGKLRPGAIGFGKSLLRLAFKPQKIWNSMTGKISYFAWNRKFWRPGPTNL